MGLFVSKEHKLHHLKYKKITIQKNAYLVDGNIVSFFSNYEKSCKDIIKINKNITFYFDEVYVDNRITIKLNYVKPIFLNKIYLSDLEIIDNKKNKEIKEKYMNGNLLDYTQLFIYQSMINDNNNIVEDLDFKTYALHHLNYYSSILVFSFKCYLCFLLLWNVMKIPIYFNNYLINWMISKMIK
jgi:hypothetical protein